VLQAEGIKLGAEHLRRIRPHNMGSLFWQLNDCWPVASWSSIDYTGRWKALQYYARRFYNNILVSPLEDNGNINVFVVSDRLNPAAAELTLSLVDFDGKKLWSEHRDIDLAPLSSGSYATIPIATLLAGKDPRGMFLLTEILVDGKLASSNEHFFQPFKNLALGRPQIEIDVIAVRGRFKITLSADKLARAVYLRSPEYAGVFADNYFDLIPGKKVEVIFSPKVAVRLSDFRDKLKIRSLEDAF
jgi:beta-mannosidase